ncbi:DUF3619 family protein [Dyella flagellata]|uniref:DUF3619 family protein n=1 Tax=Dyella flagellata TaxID=1867833 RepID=A0ABQ5XCJ9_9GAMM|nr:DUF3619 family protein [Dyella flagellata]GLQ88838.1 hypothetical protein GCM10007898_24090 [Dyella flagellata]
MNSSDKQFEKRVRALYQEASQSIDPVTAGRLRAARRTALEAATASPHHRARVLVPVGALAAVALAALMIWQPSPRPHAEGEPTAMTEQQENEYLPPGADKADPGLYQNLDFYSWLAANDSSQANR